MVKPLLTFTDVSLTDGQTSRWCGAMTTPMMAAILAQMDNAGFSAVEVISSQTIVQCLERGEDPWQRLEVLRYQNNSLAFRASINLLTEHGFFGADILSGDVIQHLLAELARRDVSQLVVIDPLLEFNRLQPVFQAAKQLGITVIGVLPFTEDESLGDSYFAEKAVRLLSLGADRIMLRDESGVLTPGRVASLVPALMNSIKGAPLILHTRCVTGLGPLVAIDAVRLGICELDTALPALANGPSLPSSKNMIRSLDVVRVQAQTPDLSVIARADTKLLDIAEREGIRPAQPWVFDLAPFVHQLPGDIAAMAVHRLRDRRQWHLLHEYARECALVRKDIGSPPMLSPYARCVAEQAFANLESEKRYATVMPGIRRALQGVYGKAPKAVNADLFAWVGAGAEESSSSWSKLLADFPSVSNEKCLIFQLTGVTPGQQPPPRKIEELIYGDTTPLELLHRGLAEYAPEYFLLSVTGPGVNIQFPSTGAPS